jgi:hypothetical protein
VSRPADFEASLHGLSKRGTQRLIQRALVLAGRSRNVRQHIREAELTSVWTIEDWGMKWAVEIRRGRLDFDRRLPHQPDIRITWPTAEGFLAEGRGSGSILDQARYEGPPEARRIWDVIHHAFAVALGEVLRNPVDQDGRRLA